MTTDEERRARGIRTYAAQFGLPEHEVETQFVREYGERFAEEAFSATGGGAWHSGTLDLKQRGLIVIAILAALGGVEPRLRGHVRWALDNGATEDEIETVVALVANYAGFPRASMAQEAIRAELDAASESH
jgi:4-carboxymuconolactone decarboxylase